MFTLNVLLSSVFIYNIRGIFDSRYLRDIGEALRISDHIKAKKDEHDDSELYKYFPNLVILL